MINWIKSIIAKIKQELAYRKRLKELKKQELESTPAAPDQPA